MYGNPQRRTGPTLALRRAGGHWLKGRREARGLSQHQLAQRLKLKHYTYVSQIETGRCRIPPDRYADWARALGLPLADFAREVVRFYDPALHAALFPEAAERSGRGAPAVLEAD